MVSQLSQIKIGFPMNRTDSEPANLPSFELKVTVKPVGFDQRGQRFHNGQFVVHVAYDTEERKIAKDKLSRGSDLADVISECIRWVVGEIAKPPPKLPENPD
jgi:hypothetical protein